MKKSPTNKYETTFNINMPNEIPQVLSEKTVESLKNLSETIKRIHEKFDLKKSTTSPPFLKEHKPIEFISPAQIEAERHDAVFRVLQLTLETQEKMHESQKSSAKKTSSLSFSTLLVSSLTLLATVLTN